MNRNLKGEILNTAHDLFKTNGYNNVSLRDIANALNISVGNLTYHFKKKEELIEAIRLHQHKNYKKHKIPETLEELNKFFVHILEYHEKNKYYFQNYDQIAEICPSIYTTQLEVIGDFIQILTCGFVNFENLNIMKTEEFKDQYKNIIEAIVSLCIHGLSSPITKSDNPYENVLKCIWSIIYSNLTQTGKLYFDSTINL